DVGALRRLRRGEERVARRLLVGVPVRGPEPAGHFAIAAGGHLAPPARVVLGAVVESPAARVRAAQLEALPTLVLHCRVEGCDQAADRADRSPSLRFQPGLATPTEAHAEAACGRRLVEGRQ